LSGTLASPSLVLVSDTADVDDPASTARAIRRVTLLTSTPLNELYHHLPFTRRHKQIGRRSRILMQCPATTRHQFAQSDNNSSFCSGMTYRSRETRTLGHVPAREPSVPGSTLPAPHEPRTFTLGFTSLAANFHPRFHLTSYQLSPSLSPH
jgi:hypothetical protein